METQLKQIFRQASSQTRLNYQNDQPLNTTRDHPNLSLSSETHFPLGSKRSLPFLVTEQSKLLERLHDYDIRPNLKMR